MGWRWNLLVLGIVALLPAFAGTAGGAQEEQGWGYEQVVDLTFPVAGETSYSNDYHANRGGGTRRHQATDVFAGKLQRIHAAVGGTIVRITGIDEPAPSYGYQLVIRGDDGREYGYIHLNNDTPGTDDGEGGTEWAYAPGMRAGVRVERGQWIGYVGDSGNAEDTPPHLHFQITDPTLEDPRLTEEPYLQGRINPYNSLQAAQERGDVPDGGTQTGADGGDQPAGADEGQAQIRRVAGRTRVETAVAMAGERDAARTVVIAPSGTHANALVGASLAGLVDAPVLLTASTGLEPVVAEEVRRLRAVNAYILGDVDELADRVEADLREAGVENVARLEADDRYGLSAVVARELLSYPSVESLDEVLLALGEADEESRAWPDALTAGALAAHTRTPILLVRPDELPAEVEALLAEARPERITVVGGEAAISGTVADAAAAASGGEVVRLAGRTRYETSVAVAAAGIKAGLDAPAVWLATGRNYPDALAAGPAAARTGAPVLLIDGEEHGGSPPADRWLDEARSTLRSAVLVGGRAAITDAVAEAVAARVQG